MEPVAVVSVQTLQVPLAAMEGDMWDRYQSRQQTPSNEPISLTLPTPAGRPQTPSPESLLPEPSPGLGPPAW